MAKAIYISHLDDKPHKRLINVCKYKFFVP
jgi:hypothetical protein